MKNCVYVLRCCNGRFYVGSTENLEIRLKQHESGSVKATRYVRPVILTYFKNFNNIRSARQAEYWIKRQKDRQLIQRLIQNDDSIFNQFSA